MNEQIITTPSGDRMVIVPEKTYRAMVEALEDRADVEAARVFLDRLARGEEELLPAAMVDRLVDGENPVRVWREHRQLSLRDLAERADISSGFLSQIESGAREGSLTTIKKIATALNITVDDLA